jgi:four helix bundle protein
MTSDQLLMNSKVYDKAYQFAIRIVRAYKHLYDEKKEFVLSKQLLRSGTSIGANIAEANGAISKVEFKAKMSIAYKECLETKYWLSLLKDTE